MWPDCVYGRWTKSDDAFYSTAAPVVGLADVIQIGAGTDHVCARTTGGKVLCWGDNDHGQLGDGTTQDRSVPTEVQW